MVKSTWCSIMEGWCLRSVCNVEGKSFCMRKQEQRIDEGGSPRVPVMGYHAPERIDAV